MPHVKLPPGIPGIVGPMTAYPETAKPLNLLAEVLLVQETPTLSKADRETIAAYVSYLNGCVFCSESHGAVADQRALKPGLSRKVWENPDAAGLSPKLRALLTVAAKVQQSGQKVSPEDVQAARAQGADDRDIHDTVLIAAAFCMYNRYVDGLATMAPPRGDGAYVEIGKMLCERGYVKAIQ